MSRNCAAINNRVEIVEGLSKHYRVEAYGCLGSRQAGFVDKIEIYSRLKFCMAMENSNYEDYVSEKLWEALEAGCLPIYMGAPNIITDFLPLPNAAIAYDPLTSSPAKLAEELRRLARNETAYNEAMEWRTLPLNELSKGYQRLHDIWATRPRLECQLCQQTALWRMAKEQEERDPRSVVFAARKAKVDRFEELKRHQLESLLRTAAKVTREKERGVVT